LSLVIVDTEQNSISVIISDTYQCFLFFVTNMYIYTIAVQHSKFNQ